LYVFIARPLLGVPQLLLGIRLALRVGTIGIDLWEKLEFSHGITHSSSRNKIDPASLRKALADVGWLNGLFIIHLPVWIVASLKAFLRGISHLVEFFCFSGLSASFPRDNHHPRQSATMDFKKMLNRAVQVSQRAPHIFDAPSCLFPQRIGSFSSSPKKKSAAMWRKPVWKPTWSPLLISRIRSRITPRRWSAPAKFVFSPTQVRHTTVLVMLELKFFYFV
jgi:hypothetical protein